MFTTSDKHLEYFLAFASVLLKIVERVVRFLRNFVGDVRELQCKFG